LETLDQPSSGIDRQVLENLSFDIRYTLPKISDILVIHGEADELIPPWHAQDLFRLSSQPKQLMILPGEDHRMSGKRHQKLFLHEASHWFKNAFERSCHGR
jgi:putative redox protein